MRKEVHEPLMRIYFLPFGIVTYLPITMSNIEETSDYAIWFMKKHPPEEGEHPFISKIQKLLQSRPVRVAINEFAIRLKVVLNNDVFFVDQNGIVLEKSSGKTFSLSKPQMEEIENDIKYFSGVIDIRASKDVVLPK
ncbi:MAG: hypothetical protein ACE5JU_23845 [Candidatus Binatia bacterium]